MYLISSSFSLKVTYFFVLGEEPPDLFNFPLFYSVLGPAPPAVFGLEHSAPIL